MTAQRTGTNVICDGPSEKADCPDNASFMDAATAADIRSRLTKEDGWLTGLPGGLDLCPKCLRQASTVTATSQGGER